MYGYRMEQVKITANKDPRRVAKRNGNIYDRWSWVHLATGVMIGWLVNPLIGLALMIAWEPFEIFILSPILAKYGILFGYETWRNSISDIVFNTLGVAIGYFILSALIDPGYRLFA